MGSERVNFGTKLGIILATAGSAVGLGNIWRFPVTTGNNGGAAFILTYIFCVIVLGIPLMVSEFVVGRKAGCNTVGAYRKLSDNLFWRKIGKVGVYTGWFILCYYIVVSGWALYYMVEALLGKFSALAASGSETYQTHFEQFISDPIKPILYLTIFMLMSHFVIVRGVEKGIEKFSKILMPALFVIMVILVGCSLFTSEAKEGLEFLLKPDFSKIRFSTFLEAMGQAFYSLSIGMACLCTYASYFKKDVNLVHTALNIGGIDTMVAIMAGIIIFPAVFSAGIMPDAGASLVFIALPNVFQEAFGGMPALCYLVSVLFYFLLVLATLTSAISLQEVVTAYLSEGFKISRKKGALIVSVSCIVIGSICSLSMGPLKELKIGSRNIFDFFDWFSGQIMLPISGLLITLFVGWVLNKKVLWDELTNGHSIRPWAGKPLVFLIRYFVPVAILLIFLSGIGLLNML